MLSAMTIQQLSDAHHARPFVPFTLHLADGRGLFVRHPDYISHIPAGRTVIVMRDDESWNAIDLLLVTELEFHAPSSPSGEPA